ncbi:MAG: hypothetical protein QOA62_07340 [Nitrososphaeraceae archaeon]|nr:hypothetical protein [Nitrososphaeraceae archaeon]
MMLFQDKDSFNFYSHISLFVLNVISCAVVFAFAWSKFNAAAGDWGSVLHARCFT